MQLNNQYKKKHGTSPVIFSWDEKDGLMLCKKVTKTDWGKRAEIPYMKKKIGIEDKF